MKQISEQTMKLLLTFCVIFTMSIYPQTWQVIGKMPVSVYGGQAVVHNNKIYILGGFSVASNSRVKLIQEYDPQSNTWSIPDSMKTGRSDFIAGIYSDSIFYAGGAGKNSSYSSSMEVWDFNSSPQIYKQNKYFDREYLTGQIVGGSLFFFGGDDQEEDDSNPPYMFEYNLTKSEVTFSDDSIYPAVFPSQQMSAILGNDIYIFGGAISVLTNTILKFNLTDKSFKIISTQLQKPRARGVAVSYDTNKILIIGGIDETNLPLSGTEVFAVNGNNAVVTPGPPLNYAREYPTAVNFNGDIYVFGGFDKNGQPVDQIEKYGSISNVATGSSSTPKSFELENNYPNPFNPSTHIKFKIARSTRVTVNIYSVLGKLVKTLTSKYYLPGEYNLTWNGTNNSGNFVPSGVYIYTLSSGYYSASKKMILLK